MFREFLILIYDYFSISKRYLLFDLALPFATAFVLFILESHVLLLNDNLLGQEITLLGIIAGFNITALSVLTTASNTMIDKLKAINSENRIGGKQINLFQELYIFISYSVLLSFIIIFFSFIGYILPVHKIIIKSAFDIVAFFNIGLTFHIFFLNVRNVSFIYFSFFNSK